VERASLHTQCVRSFARFPHRVHEFSSLGMLSGQRVLLAISAVGRDGILRTSQDSRTAVAIFRDVGDGCVALCCAGWTLLALAHGVLGQSEREVIHQLFRFILTFLAHISPSVIFDVRSVLSAI
jgi:succinate dehydrogenase/fumarate reductase cytochrome b subunit